MQQIQTKLDEKNVLIRHYLKSWANNILAIGKELTEINEQKIYKEKFNSFEEYIKNTFEFDKSYAYRYINLFKRYGQKVEQFHKLKDYGMRVLIMSIYVPEDKYEELIQVIEKSPLKDHTSMSKEVRRFAKEVGEKPRYEENLPFKEKVEERFLKAKREAQEIKEKYQEFLDIKLNLKLAINKWLDSYKYQHLINLREELKIIKLELK